MKQSMSDRASALDRQSFQSAKGAMRVIDENGVIIRVNTSYTQLCNLPEDLVLGGKCCFYFCPECCRIGECFLQKYMQGDDIRTEMDEMIFRKGDCYYLTSSLPLLDEEGDCIGILQDFRDITDYLRVGGRPGSVLAEGKRIHEIHHEVSNQLQAIIGYCQILKNDNSVLLDDKLLKCIDGIHTNAGHISTLIQAERNSAEDMTLSKKTFNLNGLLRMMPDFCQCHVARKRLNVELDIKDDVTLLHGHELKIRQLIINLLNNAIKFTHENGNIRLRADRGGDFYTITVEDDGIGIPPQDLVRIFLPNVRLKDAEKMDATGKGLGLSICREIVAQHDGKIYAENREHKGSRFVVKLPTPLVMDVYQELAEDNSLVGKKVLLIDDCPTNNFVMKKLINTYGAEAVTVDNGEQSLELVKTHDYDLILMDIEMPRMNGVETARAIRQLKGAHTPDIIAVSSKYTDSEKDQVILQGFDDFITKPIRTETFHEQLGKHIRKKISS